MFKKITIIAMALVVAIIIIPPALYFYTLSMLEGMPVRPSNISLTQAQLNELWENNEKYSSVSDIGSITPYWIYKWLIPVMVNDYFSYSGIDPYKNMSRMASAIAIHHMRTNQVKTKGMGWWHLLHVNLSIWLQRHWTPKEIAIKSSEI
ncbi:MAG: hypothetical protein ABFS56_24080 [Pseudomonadota bacterium]